MAQTPEVLQKKFGLQPDLGTRDVSRILAAFKGTRSRDKKTFQTVAMVMLMCNALPGEGRSRYTQKISQEEMAAMAGVTRVTFTRWMSKLAPLAKGYETAAGRRQHAVERRADAIKKLKGHFVTCELCAAGQGALNTEAYFEGKLNADAYLVGGTCDTAKKLARRVGELREEDAYAPQQPTPIFLRERNFCEPNTNSIMVPECDEPEWLLIDTETDQQVSKYFDRDRADKVRVKLMAKTGRRYHVKPADVDLDERTGKPKLFRYPTIDQLRGSDWWDPKYDKKGFKALSCWPWDPRILDPGTGKPLGPTPRRVMSYYEQAGLLERYIKSDGTVSEKGVLTVAQKTVARTLGISVASVYRANEIWEALGVLRIANECKELRPGVWVRDSQKVIYLPFRMLTEREAELESARIAARVREIVAREGTQRLAQLREAQRLTDELAKAWGGREHRIEAFRKELRRRLDEARIFPDLINKLVSPAFSDTPPPEDNRS